MPEALSESRLAALLRIPFRSMLELELWSKDIGAYLANSRVKKLSQWAEDQILKPLGGDIIWPQKRSSQPRCSASSIMCV